MDAFLSRGIDEHYTPYNGQTVLPYGTMPAR